MKKKTLVCTCHGQPGIHSRRDAPDKASLGTWKCSVTGRKAPMKMAKAGE